MQDNTVGTLTQVQKQIVVGLILGDGYLRKIDGRKNAFLEINHGISQKFYVDWLYKQLENCVRSIPKARRGNGNRIAYRFFTKSDFDFTKFWKEFYHDKKKVLPKHFGLTPLSLAIWFMDDGSKSKDSIYLNTQQFSLSDQKQLISILEKNFQIKSRLNKDKIYFRIRIFKESHARLIATIRPFLLKAFYYKIGLEAP